MFKKLLLTSLIFLSFSNVNAQNESAPIGQVYFAQSLFEIETSEQVVSLETSLKNNPDVKQVRINFEEQRVFVVTNAIQGLSDEEFASWFGEFASTVKCIQVGKMGVDEIHTFPFPNCNE